MTNKPVIEELVDAIQAVAIGGTVVEDGPRRRIRAALGAAATALAYAGPIWLYRVLENDDDGTPLDWGAVSAPTLDSAQQLVTAHLAVAEVAQPVEVRFLEVRDRVGVFTSGAAIDAVLMPVANRDA